MIVVKVIMCFIILIILPIILGLLITKFRKEKDNLLWGFFLGYLFEFASFEVIYLPMYFANCHLQTVQYVWLIFILIATIVSIIVNKNRFKNIFEQTWQTLKSMPKLIIIFAILLAIQIYVPVRYMQHVDPDDAFYLASTTTAIETNSMFKIVPYSGQEFGKRPLRYSLSGLVIYFAVLSKTLNIHPAILQHTIWPAIAVILEFSVYALLANELFKKDKEKVTYFLTFLSIIYMFGYISGFTNFAFFAYRSWQGKALVGNLMIPAAWLCYINSIKRDKEWIEWLIFLMAMISSCFVTEMGVFLVPLEIGVLSIITLIQDRKVSNFIKPMVCLLPQLIIGSIYILLK